MTRKLSKAMQAVVDAMADGWELGTSMSINGSGPWLQKGGVGKGIESRKVNSNTFNSLLDRGIITTNKRGFPTTTWKLVDPPAE